MDKFLNIYINEIGSIRKKLIRIDLFFFIFIFLFVIYYLLFFILVNNCNS